MGFLGDALGGLVSSIPAVGPALSSAMGLTTKPSFNIDVGSMATGLAGDYLGAKLINQPAANSAWAYSKEAATAAYERQKTLYGKRYRWTMEDMRKAGLNPMLAAKGGPMVGSAPNVHSAQSFMAHPSLGKAATSIRDVREAEKSVQAVGKLRAEQGLMETRERVEWQRIDQVSSEIMKIQEQVQLLRKQTDLTEQQRVKEKHLIKKAQREAEALGLALQKLRHINKMYNVPYVGPAVAAIKEILGSIPVGILFGGSGSTSTDSFTEYGKGWKNTHTTTRKKRRR